MQDIAERVRCVKQRVGVLHRKREKLWLSGLGALCVALSAGLIGSITSVTGDRQGTVQGMYAATMMFDGAGGYVLVGLVGFIAAVVITVLCIRQKEKSKESNENCNENCKEDDEE